MMKKIDTGEPNSPLISQNISIVEVGNYANIFERFINFVGVKSLVVTDLDSVKKRAAFSSFSNHEALNIFTTI